jgi:hypothetical protein
MTARQRLDDFLAQLAARLRTRIYLRAAAVGVAGVLAITCLAVWLLDREGFASGIAVTGRVAIIAVLAAVGVLLAWLPLKALRRNDGARVFEQQLPAQSGRIETYLDSARREREGQANPLIELLADDAATLAERTPVHDVVPARGINIAAAIGALGALALVFLLGFGPGPWGYGTRYLLLGMDVPREAVPVRKITVTPGDAVVRRNGDLGVHALIEGFNPDDVTVYVRFADKQDWERAPMSQVASDTPTKTGGSQWEFKLFALRGPLKYYVDADGAKSAEFDVNVVDLPHIEKLRLTYAYPDWTGLAPSTDDVSRDIRAVEGTNVKVEVFADAPLEAPALIIDGKPGDLTAQNSNGSNTSVGSIAVKTSGSYHIGARVANEFVALTDDYPIEIVDDQRPEIQIEKPGRDWRASNIEEVPVRIKAQDDFRLQDVELRYSVNGGPFKTRQIASGTPKADNESLLRLEELGSEKAAEPKGAPAKATDGEFLAPGDIVSYYAVAKDRKAEAETDLFIVQVQPFERRFRQGQGGGGGGGGGGDEQGEISDRQREILLATWNLQRSDERNSRSKQQLEDGASMLSELQAKLAAQARTLADRTRARSSADEDPRIKEFVDSLEKAAGVMDPAAKSLAEFKMRDAVPFEQQALQQLLRAEAAFREVQVSMQQSDGGGGQQASRNFTEMFELEMDVEKSHYESQSQMSMENQKKELEEAIRKLKELAERQEKLAQEANRQQMTAEEQRWRQEQLRREAEDLRRRLAELTRQQQQQQARSNQSQNGQQQQQNGQQQNGQPQEGQDGQSQQDQQGQSGQSGRMANNNNSSSGGQSVEQLKKTLDAVNKALEDMKAANRQLDKNQQNAQNTDQNGKQNADQKGQNGQQQDPRLAQGAESAGDRDARNRAAANASKNLRQALDQIDRKASGNGISDDIKQFADRTAEMAGQQEQVEKDLYDALAQARQSGERSRGGIEQRRAEKIAEEKRQMASDLSKLQQDMRNSIAKSRRDTPDASKRLGEIVNDLEASNVMAQMNRSAQEIYYGRAREAAPREGLIGEALENLEKDLREAAGQAAGEAKSAANATRPEELLAQIGELRRQLEEQQRIAQNGRNGQNGQQQNGQQQSGQQQGGQQQGDGQRGSIQGDRNPGTADSGDQQQQARAGEQGQRNGQNPSQSQSGSSPGSAQQAGSQNVGGSDVGLTAWNPTTGNGPQNSPQFGSGSLAPQTAALADRIRNLAERMRGGNLSQTELDALRRSAQQLRRLAGNPLASQVEAMKLVDQIELAALTAVKRSEDEAAAHIAMPNPDSPRYREQVAEYYRRLGGGT